MSVLKPIRSFRRKVRPVVTLFCALLSIPHLAVAESPQQCNEKLSSTIYGRSATSAELAITNPLGRVDDMIKSREFIDHFAGFVNAQMEWIPDDGGIINNPVYLAMTRYMFDGGTEKDWAELFTGNYELHSNGFNTRNQGSGYFSDRVWKRKYRGNEEDGFKLRTAYLILNNTIGLNLEALTVNNSGGSGREARSDPSTVCYACHYREEFALDRIANVLPKVNREASDDQNLIESPPPGPTPQTIYGTEVSSMDELVDSLVTTDEFYTNACNIAFRFAFGRDERGADKDIFRGCLDSFKADGKITTAVRHYINSGIFCPNLEG